jgi:hypothetical protein
LIAKKLGQSVCLEFRNILFIYEATISRMLGCSGLLATATLCVLVAVVKIRMMAVCWPALGVSFCPIASQKPDVLRLMHFLVPAPFRPPD